MEDKQGGGWKWIAGGLALVVSYQMGYESGSERAAAGPSPIAQVAQSGYVSTADEPLVGSDALSSASPVTTTTSDLPADLAGDVPAPAPDETNSIAAAGESRSAPAGDGLRAWAAEAASDESSDSILATADDRGSEVGSPAIGSSADTLASWPSPASARAPETEPGTYGVAKPASYGCAENGSCYGDISASTGRPKTVSVRGYYRRDGTYVRGHYRSRPR